MTLAEAAPQISRRASKRRCCSFPVAGLLMAGVIMAVSVAAGADTGVTSIAQKEVRRREALVREAGSRLAEADDLMRSGNMQAAVDAYSQVYNSLPKAEMAAGARDHARAGFAAASCNRARELMAEARYAEALEMLDRVLAPDVDPGNVDAKKLKVQFQDPDRFPRALTPAHIGNVKEVEKKLEFANSAMELGDYDKAIATWQDVLRIDPYNKSARRGMERAERLRSEYFDAARDHTRAKMLSDVDSLWEQGVTPADVSERFSGQGSATNVRSGREAIVAKMSEMIIPKVDFNGSTLEEVVEYLRVRSRDLDPKGRGVDFVVNLPPDSAARPVTLYLEQVPLNEVLRYVTEKAGATFRVEERAVMIVSLSENSTQLIPKTYRVPPNFIQTSLVGDGGAAGGAAPADPFAAQKPAAGAGGGLQVHRMGAKEFLESRGVSFKVEGSSAAYIPATNTLIVRNTPESLAVIDQLVEQVAETAPKQVLVSVRLMEINQKNFEEIRQDIGLGMANVPGSDRVFASGGATNSSVLTMPGVYSTTEGLRKSGEILGQASIDSLLTTSTSPPLDSASPVAFQLLGAFTDPQFQVSLSAISQKKGIDLVSVPSVITKSGVKTEIEMVREFPYPTEFDPPQIPQNVGGSTSTAISGGQVSTASALGAIPITPTTPTAFETRKIGSLMELEAVVSPDGRQVELTLAPSTTEFEGFINYGSPITNSSSSTTFDPITFAVGTKGTSFLVDNKILQPIFRTNKLSTGVLVWDGSTVVIGGVISEKKEQITDKVPLLGDLPVIGKLWQNKMMQIQKKNVIFFVTVKVIDAAGQPIRQPATTAQAPVQ